MNKVSAQEVAAISELHDLMATRLRSAAEAKAANGALKMTQLAYAAAADYYCQATAFMEQMPAGSDEPLALYLTEWGSAAYHAGDYRGAEPPCQRALTIYEAVLGGQHPDVATSLNNLAALYDAQGRYSEAEPLYQRALTIYEAVLGGQHPHVAIIREHYTALLRATNRNEEAEKLAARAQTERHSRI